MRGVRVFAQKRAPRVGAAAIILHLLARLPLPLWKPRPNQTRSTTAGKRPHGLRRDGARGAGGCC